MKYLLTLFLVAMALQPPALQACAMDDDQPDSHHAAMQQEGDMDCCSADGNKPAEPCDEAAQCAFFSLGFLVIPGASGVVTTVPGHHYVQIASERHLGPPAQPPFRPPIA